MPLQSPATWASPWIVSSSPDNARRLAYHIQWLDYFSRFILVQAVVPS